jgi:hypothetical protein
MTVSFVVAIAFFIAEKGFEIEFSSTVKLLSGVGITTIAWIVVTLLTQNDRYLNPEFHQRAFDKNKKFKNMGYKVLSIFFGCIGIYAALFSLGNYLVGNTLQALYFLFAFIVSSIVIALSWKKLFV